MASSELDCRWHFAPSSGGQDQGPNEAMSELFKKDPFESLVRESIQNSLDAVYDKSLPVHVHFRWRKMNGNSYEGLFGLRKHFQECIDFWKSDAAKDKFLPMMSFIDESFIDGMSYLEVSDSNTTGMDYVPHDRSCPFYSFVRSAGNSSKAQNTAGGSYGFGKAAYFNVSRVRSVLVSTQTPAGKTFFEGVSSICTHEHEGTKCTHVGYYDNNEGQPISNVEKIPTRFRREEPGTSVYIVGIKPTEGFVEVIKAVLMHFWLSILEEKLTVSLRLTKDNVLEINKDNLDMMMTQYFPEEQDKKRGHSNPRPYYDAVKYASTDKKHILVQQNLPTLGRVRFYIYKNKQANDRVSYMRSPRMLVWNKPNTTSYGFYGVFVCDDPRGNNILRYSENPSHSEWDWRNCPEARQQTAKEALSELKDFISATLQTVFSSNGATFLNITGLDEFLYIPTAYEETDEYDSEAFTGAPTGEIQEEGTSSTTTLVNPVPFSAEAPKEKTATGHVLVNYRALAESAEDGDLFSGHTSRPRKTKGGGEPAPKLPKESNVETDDGGTMGTYAHPIEVNYRSFAQVEGGIVYHVIIIHSDILVEDGQVVIFTGGEQSDERISVVSSNVGTVIDNTVVGLHLQIGKNMMKIRLADDMKHAIKLEAYENK